MRLMPWLIMSVLFAASAAQAHEFYTGQRSPDGKGCCNEVDCSPREVRLNSFTDELEVLINRRWWPLMDPRWYLGPSPDGSVFGCQMPSDPVPRCVWGGAGT